MRGLILSAICLGVFSAESTWAAQDDFPYGGYVATDRVAVRSGPGKVHYATDYLDQGTKVEIYRHDPGGWCAIRPPDGSFSWVSAAQLQITSEPGIGQVLQDDVKAWIGSRQGEIGQRMWQVLLRKGERVEVIGEKQGRIDAGGAIEKWYKIAPPAGEFRWIQQKFISREPTEETPAVVLTTPSGAWRQRADDEAAPQTVTQPSLSPAASTSTAAAAPTNDVATRQAVQPPPLVGQGDDFESRLSEVEIELSLVLATQVKAWQFDSIRQQATTLLGHASTDTQRGQARLLLDKIERFQLLQQDVAARPISDTSSGEFSASGGSSGASAVGNSSLDVPGLVDSIDPRYDGAGVLVPVHARTPSAPAYALLDEEGNVLQYVTPVPGFNLRRYLRQEIGVYGQRGYIPHLNVPHIAARRVVVLDRHRR